MRVVIVEDNVMLAEGLTLLLTKEDVDVVATVGDVPSFVAAVREHRPDAAVVDVRLPPSYQDEGLAAVREVRVEQPDLPVLVFSQYVEETYAAELLGDRRGGIGYLLKDRVGRVEEFLDALNRVAAGGTVMDPEVVRQLLARKDHPLAALTPRERDVLELMAQGHGNARIAERLYVTERAVHKHVGNIFAKLGLPHSDDGQHRRVLAVLAYLDT